MKKRTIISRICPECKKEEFIRKDAAGKYCRKCRAILNSRDNVGKYIDIAGMKFGRLTAIDISCKKSGTYRWNCICDCGSKLSICGSKLRGKHTRSCGCITRKHGLSNDKTFMCWKSMKNRCYSKSFINYHNYGGRGIIVCDRWMTFENFIEDMGERPEGMSLDRINSLCNYEVGNCRWATTIQQANNVRTNNIIEVFNRKQTLHQWAREYSIMPATLNKRLLLGWTTENALTIPVRSKNAKKEQKENHN